MNRNAVLFVVIVLLSSSGIPLSVSAEANEPRDPPTVKIGFLNPLTGPIAVYAPPFTAAAEKAIDDLNAAGGNFELVETDSGCSADVANGAAQTLVDAGVVGVAGAACSGASMGANAVLSAAGIPQISYASTNPGLSDASAYPLFFRVVPSDALQGNAISYAFNETGASNPALMHMTNDYGSGLADSFADAWGGADFLCAKIGYEDTTTDFTAVVQQISDYGCDSLVMISYSSDGAAIVETMDYYELDIPIFGGDGIASLYWVDSFSVPELVDGVIATKPSVSNTTNATTTFANWCSSDSTCSGGIYTAEAYDAVRLIGEAYLTSQSSSIPLVSAIFVTGNHWEGASGEITFMNNGDSVGNGWDICEFDYSSGQASLGCPETWYPASPNWPDSDGDGVPDLWDSCPNDPNGWMDTDGDGVCNYADDDDDGDGWTDVQEIECESNPVLSQDIPLDYDGDGTCNGIDQDDDGDGHPDDEDDCPLDENSWYDIDGDGLCSNEDEDDDGDGWNDWVEANCGSDPELSSSTPLDYDTDQDGYCDAMDSDDDNDGWSDEYEMSCNSNTLDYTSTPQDINLDFDQDGWCDSLDTDDDNDYWNDDVDEFPYDGSEWNDHDHDGIGDNADFDDDGDSWADVREEECGYDSFDFNSTPPDLDFDNECDELDPDDDGDMILDHLDAFPRDNSEWSDNDLDGIGDNADEDDDNDYWTDTAENACGTSPTNNYSYPSDNDADEICDVVDDDDDNDGVADTSDAFPFISAEWLDTDSDGIGNNADLDDDADLLSDEIELQMGTDPLNEDTDGDGYYDSIDDLPLDSTEWSDGDGDGTGDNSDAFPSIARYQTTGRMILDVIMVVVVLGCLGTLISAIRSRD